MTMTRITITNVAGGDRRTFRAPTDASGRVIDAPATAVRHARRQGAMGFGCSDSDAHDRIQQYLDDAREED